MALTKQAQWNETTEIYMYIWENKKPTICFIFDSFFSCSLLSIIFCLLLSFRSARFLAKNNITMSQWPFFRRKKVIAAQFTQVHYESTHPFFSFIADWNNGNGDLMNFNVGKKNGLFFFRASVLPKLNRIYWPSMVIFRKVLSLNIITSF